MGGLVGGGSCLLGGRKGAAARCPTTHPGCTITRERRMTSPPRLFMFLLDRQHSRAVMVYAPGAGKLGR